MKIIYRYIFKSLLTPFIFSVFLITGVMLANEMILLMNFILKKGVPLSLILQMAFMVIKYVVALSIPMSTLLATIMTFGKMTEDNEIMVLKSCGVSLYKLLPPILIFGVLISLTMFLFHNNILPENNYQFKLLKNKIKKQSPTIGLEENMFNELDDILLYAQAIDRTQNLLIDLVIYDYSKSKIPNIINAEKGYINYNEKDNRLKLRLFDGQIHSVDPKDVEQYTIINFNQYVYQYQMKTDSSDNTFLSRGEREMNCNQLLGRIDTLNIRIEESKAKTFALVKKEAEDLLMGKLVRPERTAKRLAHEKTIRHSFQLNINNLLVEIHKKYAISVACFVFVLLGLPLGVRARRGGAGPGIVISMVFFVFYYGCLIAGEELGENGTVAPWLAIWFANMVLFPYSLVSLYRTVQETKYIQWEHFKFWKFFSKSSK